MASVALNVTVPGTTLAAERRYETALTVQQLKDKLVLVTGIEAKDQTLTLVDSSGHTVATLSTNTYALGDYPVKDNMTLQVTGARVQVEDVAKFELPDEVYDKRTDSVREFKRKMKLGRYSDEAQAESTAPVRSAANDSPAISVGARCQVITQGMPPRLATVLYVGHTHFKEGWWVGVQYDEPVGKNDGSVDGQRYFTCPAKYGGFVVPSAVTVGDFPEETFDDDDEM
eukprot:comp17805_c0_seq1/m.17876 comp17805_c0_seq1/g.17876  ORF comp17805_c0_seq1/g.17876 comp17805_c0_seq1/m.17876 type:complete len:228 (-) comp17805_c0_seq1:626-1309(-)